METQFLPKEEFKKKSKGKKKFLLFGIIGLFIISALVIAGTGILTTPSQAQLTENEDCGGGWLLISNGRIRTLSLFSSTRYIKEDDICKKVEDARSLMGTTISPIFLEQDKDFPIEVLDYNYTTLTITLTTAEKNFDKDIPLKIWRDTLLTGKKDDFKNNYNQISLGNKRFNLASEIQEIIMPIKVGDIIEFGFNSTSLNLNDDGSQILHDTFVAEDTDSSHATDLSVSIMNVTDHQEWVMLMFNHSIIPSAAIINNADVTLYLNNEDLDAGESYNVTIHHIYNSFGWSESIKWSERANLSTQYNLTQESSYVFADGVSDGHYKWNATNIMSSAMINGGGNVSFYLIPTTTGGTPSSADNINFRTKEAPSEGQNPALNVTYTIYTPDAEWRFQNITGTIMFKISKVFGHLWTRGNATIEQDLSVGDQAYIGSTHVNPLLYNQTSNSIYFYNMTSDSIYYYNQSHATPWDYNQTLPVNNWTGNSTAIWTRSDIAQVGIGTTTPNAKLEVNQPAVASAGSLVAIKEDWDSALATTRILLNLTGQIDSDGGTTYGVYSDLLTAGLNQLNQYGLYTSVSGAGNDWGLYVDTSDKNYIDSKLSIGTTSSSFPLAIESTAGAIMVALNDSGASSEANANPIIGMYQGSTGKRLGYVGYGSGTNADLYITNDLGNIRIRTAHNSSQAIFDYNGDVTFDNQVIIPNMDSGTGSYVAINSSGALVDTGEVFCPIVKVFREKEICTESINESGELVPTCEIVQGEERVGGILEAQFDIVLEKEDVVKLEPGDNVVKIVESSPEISYFKYIKLKVDGQTHTPSSIEGDLKTNDYGYYMEQGDEVILTFNVNTNSANSVELIALGYYEITEEASGIYKVIRNLKEKAIDKIKDQENRINALEEYLCNKGETTFC